MPVEIVEVGDDDGHRQGDSEYSGNDAESSNQFAEDTDGRDVAVTDRRHRDDGPPERTRDGRELAVLLAGLGVVRCRAEDDHGDQQEEEEHPELVKARLDRHTEDPQTLQSSRTDSLLQVQRKLSESGRNKTPFFPSLLLLSASFS